jgi:hypothetical protein
VKKKGFKNSTSIEDVGGEGGGGEAGVGEEEVKNSERGGR